MEQSMINSGDLISISEDPAMDELEEILRQQEFDRVEMFMDLLEVEAAEEELRFINRRSTDG